MKLVRSLVIAALVAVPVLSFAQSSQPVTRAEVKAELVQLQKAGYRESSDYTQYPAHLQTTLARISAESGATASASASAFGGVALGTTAAGSRTTARAVSNAGVSVPDQDAVGLEPIYAHS